MTSRGRVLEAGASCAMTKRHHGTGQSYVDFGSYEDVSCRPSLMRSFIDSRPRPAAAAEARQTAMTTPTRPLVHTAISVPPSTVSTVPVV
jgi:hypothetical protein